MNGQAIDRSALKRLLVLLGNDPAELEDLLSDYKEDAPELARRVLDAAERGDVEAVRIATHTLKANADDFGAVRLSALCARLEQAARAGGPAERRDVEDLVGAEEEARLALAEINLDELQA